MVDSPCLFTIPHELLLQIFSHLPTEDRICLALSCKSMYSVQGDQPWNLLKEDKKWHGYLKDAEKVEWKILERLERDLPHHHLCVWERKLRIHTEPVPPKERRRNDLPRGWDQCRVRNGDRQISASMPASVREWMWPTFCEVRLITNRHRLGDAYGVPLNHLDVSTPWMLNRTWRAYLHEATRSFELQNVRSIDWYSKLDVKTRIIENQLQLHRSERCLISREEAAFLLANRERIKIEGNYVLISPVLEMPGCIHQESELRRIRAGNIIELLHFASMLARLDKHSHGPRGHIDCLNCGAHVRYTVYNHDEAGYEVVIDVWQNLGDGRYVDVQRGWTACYANGNKVMKSTMERKTRSRMNPRTRDQAAALFAKLEEEQREGKQNLQPRPRRANSLDTPRLGFADDLLKRKTTHNDMWARGQDLEPHDLLDICRDLKDWGVYCLYVPQRRASIHLTESSQRNDVPDSF